MTDSFQSEAWADGLSPLLADDVATYLLHAVGPCRVQLSGEELSHMAGPLLAAGCGIAHQEGWGVSSAAVDVIIAWLSGSEDRDAWLNRDLDAEVLVLVSPTGEGDVVHWIEESPTSDWMPHPAVFALPAPPEGVNLRMLTRSGIELTNQAGLARASYHGLAAALVRPGDAVLATDAAENAVWRIVLQQSRCSWLGVISELPPPPLVAAGLQWYDAAAWTHLQRPIDVLIGGWMRERSQWMQTLQFAQKALIRSGRLVMMLPLDPDLGLEPGGLQELFEQMGFVIDRAWWKVPQRPVGPEQFIEFPQDASGQLALGSEPVVLADAVVLMAVSIGGAAIARDPTVQASNLIAFQRDYIDASVVRQIVAVGLRLESSALRRRVANQVMRDAPEDSADYGAALCVLLYDQSALRGEAREQLLGAARRFIDGPASNPTAFRWQVSLAFASASVYQSGGDLDRAAELYSRVLEFDVLAFSPLLGTKTTAAALRLGWIHFARGELAESRRAWAIGLDEARRLASQPDWTAVVGNPDAPETFAMPELAVVMDEAGCLAAALRLTSEVPIRPGLAWQWASRSWRSQLQDARTEQQRRQVWQDNLQAAKDWLDSQYRQLNAELDRREQVIQELDLKASTLSTDIHGVRSAYRLAHLHAVNEKAQLAQQLSEAYTEREDLLARNATLADENQRLADSNQQLTGAHNALAENHQQIIGAHHALTESHEQLIGAHWQLINAAQQLSVAAGEVMGRKAPAKVPAEHIADELSSQALALERMPMKAALGALARSLAFMLGRK